MKGKRQAYVHGHWKNMENPRGDTQSHEYGPTERGVKKNKKTKQQQQKTQACEEIYTGTIPCGNTSTKM